MSESAAHEKMQTAHVPRVLVRCVVGAAILLGLLAGCSSTPATDPLSLEFAAHKYLFQTVNEADRLVLYEGLPNGMAEPELAQRERQRTDLRLFDRDPFYPVSLEFSAADAAALKAILSRDATFGRYVDKKCYHPDYRVEWSRGSMVYGCHLCFGCDHVILVAPGRTIQGSMTGNGYAALRDLLKPYRKARPGNPSAGWH